MKKTKKTKVPPSIPFEPKLYERLKDLEYAAHYLTASLGEGVSGDDFDAFFAALGDIAKAHGVKNVAAKIGATRDALYKARKHKNMGFQNFASMVDALDMKIQFVPKDEEQQKTY